MKRLAVAAAFLVVTSAAEAAKVSDITTTNLGEQAVRFFTFQDPSLRYALIGSILLGITCGLLGSFIVVRKMALVGDALSHAVLPGVALGFLWGQTKDPVAIFVGATVAGLLGTTVVSLIKQTTRLKEDAALGLVLASFFAVGICLVTMIQRLPTGNKSGIDKFLFGQAAAISAGDVRLIAIVALLAVILITLFYKECLVTSFDAEFARAAGFPTQWIHHGIMLLLAFAIVVALQAVGVVLVSAMLITPAAAAYLLTDRMHRMLLLAAAFGMMAGVLGAFLSFLGNNLPTGPFHGHRCERGLRRRIPLRSATRRARALVETTIALRPNRSRERAEIDLPCARATRLPWRRRFAARAGAAATREHRGSAR
jgi:manganese/zinc/iron transport system permease protein